MAPSRSKHANQTCVIPGGFTVLSLQFSTDIVAQHKICVKEHRVRAEKTTQRPLDRTLFVLNIPPYCSEGVIKELFSQFGPVQSVELREKPGSFEHSGPKLAKYFTPAQKQRFRVGYIVFQKAIIITAVKSHPHDVPLVVSTEQQPVWTGLQKWIHQYKQSFAQPDKLQEAVDTFMQDYDTRKEQEAERQKEEAEEQLEDEEGWVKVTRGKSGTKTRPHSEVSNQKALQKESRKRKRKELMNFYTWQHRNTQKEHIAELRKKFEEDKQRIALLRAQRKFRPY
ncbi:ribosomal RNA-processing protein 7 homolog A isoform X2 [Oncorhynchus tshawytscha]|uniref:RRM domain-containing protein n=1 Tax=Oncorhynchus tshawytscha TaxID=74940 RepID=A0AAZ3RFL6_ONCTS|nr:ribosomal RNA-processing protein 7 homolog A isoform X2 [Oncorhynchus tshawytscha]